MNLFDQKIVESFGQPMSGADIEVFQVNVGLKCNQACVHCHVKSSPSRKEMMTWETMQQVIDAARRAGSLLVDITGGAPEIHPHLKPFIEQLREYGFDVQVRTNLTILLEDGYTDFPEFFKEHNVCLAASLPCYLQENVDKQRGDGVYEGSIKALQRLNEVGYGVEPEMQLNLVYNPLGPHLPPNQASLEQDYRRELRERFGVSFTQLLTIANMPIGRFQTDLRRQNKDEDYMDLLVGSFNHDTVDGLMCRHQVNVDWDGVLYDCDFNLALKLPVNHGAPNHIKDFDPNALAKRQIETGDHCFGCTAGCGSSCGGALLS